MKPNLSLFDELADEIISSGFFKNEYCKLLTQQKISDNNPSEFSEDEICFLLQSASIFSVCKNEDYKMYSYKIASILVDRYSEKYEEISKIAQYILISAGLIPVVKKIVQDTKIDFFSTYSDTNIPFSPLQFKNIILKQSKNCIDNNIGPDRHYLTDFQIKSYNDLKDGKSISLSAPTSAGKSFLLVSYLSRKISDSPKLNVVYIVPTRALISQVMRDISDEFKNFNQKEIFIVSSAKDSYSEVPTKIFILTQERFHNLLFDSDFKESIDVLIIDEAQKVSDQSRGILLEEVIEETIKRYPKVQKIFLSPFSSNPEIFSKMFNLTDLISEKTKLSPVSQNLLILDIDEKILEFDLNLSTVVENDNVIIPIKRGKLSRDDFGYFLDSDNPDDDSWKLLWAVKQFGDELNIIYCNKPETSVTLARSFSKLFPDTDDPQILEAIQYLMETIHKDYYLVKCLKKGIGYHHGEMPNHIRNIVEELFRDKKLKYLFCTSTLLEGVNLPVKNIFIHKPKIGRKPLTNLNFWNLAGRAGRLLKDYYGNIFCVNVSEWDGYSPNPKDIEHTIESILEETILTKDKIIISMLKDLNKQLKLQNQPIEQAITKFIIQSINKGDKNFVENLLKRNPNFDVDKLQAIKDEIKRIADQIEIDPEIIRKNSSIHPIKQQRLSDEFSQNLSSVRIPIYPTSENFYDQITEIYRDINRSFLNKKEEDNSHVYYGLLSTQWIKGNSFSEMIRKRLEYMKTQKKLDEQTINEEIEKLFRDLNNGVMFKYQKYLKCYIDILSYQYSKNGWNEDVLCKKLPQFIEYGSYLPNVMIFQSLGISRNTALILNKYTRGKTFENELECYEWLKQFAFPLKENLHPIIFREIEKLL